MCPVLCPARRNLLKVRCHAREKDGKVKTCGTMTQSQISSSRLLNVGGGPPLPFLECTSWQNSRWQGRMRSCSRNQQGCTPNSEWRPGHCPLDIQRNNP